MPREKPSKVPKTVLRIHHKQGWWSMAEIFLPLFSLTGIFFGLILSFIAPEELSPGRKHFVSFLPYLLFLPVFFLNTKPPFHLVLATLIFLYGFPLGTLLRVKDEEQKQS